MSKKHLQLDPHDIDSFWWWYEEPKGLCIVHQEEKEPMHTESRTIPWRLIRAALKRKDGV